MQFRLLGFDVRLDFTFLFIGILFFGLFSTAGLVLFLAVSGLTVLMHEMGHALTARRVGGEVLSVNLQGFGGFTAWLPNERITNMQRFWVAAAGPLYQLALGAVLWVGISIGALGGEWADFLRHPLDWTGLRVADLRGEWVAFIVLALAILSVLWAIFNLIPIFGLDGYTMVKELMLRLSPSRGNDIARIIGLVVSVGLVAVFAVRGLIFGALWVGYIAFSNYGAATRKEPVIAAGGHEAGHGLFDAGPAVGESAGGGPVIDVADKGSPEESQPPPAEGDYWPYEPYREDPDER